MSLSNSRVNPNIQNHYFDYNGTYLAWEHISIAHSNSSTASSSNAPLHPLIILHGWGASKKIMRPLGRTLAMHHDCYVIDLAGFGESSKPPVAWRINDYVDSIKAWVEHIGLDTFDILAHSFGGRITLKLLTQAWSKKHVKKV